MDPKDLEKKINVIEYHSILEECIDDRAAKGSADKPAKPAAKPEIPEKISSSGVRAVRTQGILPWSAFLVLCLVEVLLLLSWSLFSASAPAALENYAATNQLQAQLGADFHFYQSVKNFLSAVQNPVASEAEVQQAFETLNTALRTTSDGYDRSYKYEDFDPAQLRRFSGMLDYSEESQ